MAKTPALTLAALLRVSTTGQVEDGYGLDQQQAATNALFLRTGHRCYETLVDDGVSGQVRNRPAVKRALELLAAGTIQGIVTPNIDRIGRGAHIIHDILNAIRSAGGVVLYANVEIPEGPAGRLLENALVGIAEYEHAMIRERTMKGRQQKAQSRRYPSGLTLFGYRLITRAQAAVLPEYAGRDGELEIVPAEAEILRELFQRAADGETRCQLVKWLNSRCTGVRGGQWSRTGLRRLLSYRAYIGELAYGAAEWREVPERVDESGARVYDGIRRTTRALRPEGGQVVPCPAIIEREVWERVQQRLQATADVDSLCGVRTAAWALRGCLRCHRCKQSDGKTPVKLRGQRNNTNSQRAGYQRRAYRCPVCGLSVQSDKVEGQAFRFLEKAFTAEAATQRERQRQEAETQASADLPEALAKVRAALRQCDEEETRAASLLLDAGFSPHIVQERVQQIQARRSKHLETLRGLEARAAETGGTRRLDTLLQQARETLTRLEQAKERPELLQELFRVHIRGTLYSRGRMCWELLG